jgi:hypothetical protein
VKGQVERRALPALDRDDPSNVLDEFLSERVRGWGTVPARLSPVETGALWILFALNAAFGAWLLAVQASTAACGGPVCTVITLGDHATLALVLTGVCVGATVVATPLTRGLTRAGGTRLGVIAVAGFSGVVAVAGVVAVVVAVALGLALTFGLLLFVIDRL